MKTFLSALLALVPVAVYAQSGSAGIEGGFTTFGGLITTFTRTIVTSLSTLFAATAMVVFFYGIIQYLLGIREGKEEKIRDGNRFIRWGLVALFVMFSVWGIIIAVQQIFKIQNGQSIIIPEIKLQNGGSPSPSPTAAGFTCAANGFTYNTQRDYDALCPSSR